MMTQKTTITSSLARFSAQNIVVILFGLTACLVVILRSMSPLMMNTDPSIQIGSALALLNGDGLGTYALNDDISQPPKLSPLTWFPPGLSIAIFLLAQLGFSVAIALKLIYAIASLAGWFGWGLIFRDVMREQRQTLLSKSIAIVLSILLPLYFTYDWVGTDLLLWAGIPFIIRWFYVSQQPRERNVSLWIGGLIGLMYAFRYAAIFLLVGFALFFVIKRRGWKNFAQIVLGFSAPYVAISIYRSLVTTSLPSQLAVTKLLQPDFLLSKTMQILAGLRQVRFLLFSHASTLSSGGKILGVVSVCVLLLYASILLRGGSRKDEPGTGIDNDRLKIILCLNVGLLLFLAAISYVSSVDFVYLADHRYYYPLFPSLILVAYEAGFKLTHPTAIRDRLLKTISLICIGGLIFATITLFVREPDRVFGFDRFDTKVLAHYPSNDIVNKDPESHQKMIELLKQNPQAIAITFAEDFDIYHTEETSIRKRLLPASIFTTRFFSKHTVGRDLPVYLVFSVEPNCKTYCYYNSGKEVELIKQIPKPKMIYANAAEGVKVFSTQLPKGFQFTLALQ